MATKKPTIEELAAQVQESVENVRRAHTERHAALSELRRRVCCIVGNGNYEKGREFLTRLLADDWERRAW